MNSQSQGGRPTAETPKSTEDLALIKELAAATDYKFLLPAASNKLTSIKHLPIWFSAIVKMLARFDPEAFLFGTVASLNNGSELQLRTSQLKLEHDPVKQESSASANPNIRHLVAEEVRVYGGVTTYAAFGLFLEGSSYKAAIMQDEALKYLCAPTLFPRVVGGGSILSRTQQFKSPEYQETILLGDDTGLTLVSDQRKFVFPSEQRINSAKAVTFHYVRGDKRPEVRLHQLLRPHFWRWLTVALTGTDFAHLLTMGWECDHTWVFQRLIEQADNEREQVDQLFAILAVTDELRTKSPSENLMTWYVKALKTIHDLNAVTRTYREDCGLMILPVTLAESMYMVHAHREGYAEVMSRVSRENKGYMPILELQKAIANIVVDKNRQNTFSKFDSGKHQKGHAKQPQVTATAATGGVKLDCCYKFLEGKCHEDPCIHPHVKVPIPPSVCAKFLADNKSCTGGCGKPHDRWSGIVRKINSGELPSAPSKKSKKKAKQINATTVPPVTPPPLLRLLQVRKRGGEADAATKAMAAGGAKEAGATRPLNQMLSAPAVPSLDTK